ncbi:hypothetical protein GCM10009528_14380 [Kineococcus aurantiacus]
MVAGLAACGGGAPDPAPTTTTASAAPTTAPTTATVTSASAGPTSTGPGFDCPSVQAAQEVLDEDYSAELDRLGIKRGDPRAQSVFTVVTTNEGPTYYAAVLAAAPPEATPDAQVVLDYYARLATQVGTLDAGTGSAEDLAAAMDALDEASVVVNPDPAAATRVVEAQERLQAAVEQACAEASSSPSSTPSGSTGSPGGAATGTTDS